MDAKVNLELDELFMAGIKLNARASSYFFQEHYVEGYKENSERTDYVQAKLKDEQYCKELLEQGYYEGLYEYQFHSAFMPPRSYGDPEMAWKRPIFKDIAEYALEDGDLEIAIQAIGIYRNNTCWTKEEIHEANLFYDKIIDGAVARGDIESARICLRCQTEFTNAGPWPADGKEFPRDSQEYKKATKRLKNLDIEFNAIWSTRQLAKQSEKLDQEKDIFASNVLGPSYPIRFSPIF